MDRSMFFLLVVISRGSARLFCQKDHQPLEVGKWRSNLKHLDSGVVENNPVTMVEGQVYVYENDFPGYTIAYIHVDNLAIKTCGAMASIKAGGVGTSTVLLVLRAEANNEIRSVVDIWGAKNFEKGPRRQLPVTDFKNIRSLYLFKDWRTVNHNVG